MLFTWKSGPARPLVEEASANGKAKMPDEQNNKEERKHLVPKHRRYLLLFRTVEWSQSFLAISKSQAVD